MEFGDYFKSIAEQDHCAIVICNCAHEIIYMNPAAKKSYAKYGGGNLVGKSIFDCHNPHSVSAIKKVVEWFMQSKTHNRIYTAYHARQQKDVYIVALRNAEKELIGYYEKHEFRKREKAVPYGDIL